MTYGQLILRAHAALRAAAVLARGARATDARHIAGVLAARNRVLSGLIRLVRLLPVDPDQGRLPEATVLLRALTSAQVHVDRHQPVARSDLMDRLDSAADDLAIAGDILASHIDPINGPRTPDGAVIARGTGRRAALAELARLTTTVAGLDQSLPSWIGDDPNPPSPAAGYIEARTTIAAWTHRLGRVGKVAGNSAGKATPISALAIAPGRLALVPSTPADCVGALHQVRVWLFRHSDQVESHHLAAVVRIGLILTAAAEVTGGPDSAAHTGWRQAAAAFRDIAVQRPPAGDGRFAVLRDIGDLLRATPPDPTTLAALTGRLPALADSLQQAILCALARGVILVKNTGLDTRSRGGIYHAVTRWRPAGLGDPPIRWLFAGLDAAIRPAIARRTPTTIGRGFPPLGGSRPTAAPRPPTPGPRTKRHART